VSTVQNESMKDQNYVKKNKEIAEKFLAWRRTQDISSLKRLNLGWSNWGFGKESFEESLKRLANHNIHYIELHGNHYGSDFGYKEKEIKPILKTYGVEVSGICGMVSIESELSSSSFAVRQRSLDYFRKEAEFCASVGGKYILFAAGAVGRPAPDDAYDYQRSVESMKVIAEAFEEYGIRGAVEPVRSDEVSVVHTFAEAKQMIKEIGRPGIQHIAGDVFHMELGEEHIAGTIMDYPGEMTNLHLADSHRRALGTGMLDLDTILMALYLTGYNNQYCFCSPEPLGGGSDPYAQMHGYPDKSMLDQLVAQTASYFYEREGEILNTPEEEIRKAYDL
ncbi:MAG TPA: sugar phosphate isomerase/epimerase family protein, partial [Anaerovoracaceae bacterium]|nr:sugar phosphate isomerase/epimerase family protein [Anaerovoracaceae bacterium]